MARFTNFATLTYTGGATNSNTVTGEIQEVLTLTKEAATAAYAANGRIPYVLSLVNSGTTAITGLVLTDDLGAYTLDGVTRYPLAYVAGTMRYYVNGVLQTTPTVEAGPPLVISGLTVPAGAMPWCSMRPRSRLMRPRTWKSRSSTPSPSPAADCLRP